MIVVFGGPLRRAERLALGLGIALVLALMWPLRSALTDTAFVWLRYADHLARGSGLVFNDGERVYACTNPLWVALLADAVWLGLDGLTCARVLGGLSTVVSVAVFLQLMRRTVRTPFVRAAATLGWASQAWMIQWSVSGLETPLAVALVLAGFVALTEGPEWGDRPVRTGALWALAALTRPGAALLLLLWGTALLIDAQNRPGLRRLVFGLTPALLIYGSWILFARVYFGTFWPQVLSVPPPEGQTLAEWGRRFWVELSAVGQTEGALLVTGVLAIVLGRFRPPSRDHLALRLLPLAWAVLLPALFAARGLSVGPRQLVLVLPVIHWLVWRAVDRWWSGEEATAIRRTVALSAVLGVLVVGQNLATYRSVVLPSVRSGTVLLERSLVRWGRWLSVHAPPHASVASFSPGALAYFGNVRVVDLGGFLTPQVSAVLNDVPEREIVSRLAFAPVARTDFVVDRGVPMAELLRTSPHAQVFEPLESRGEYAFYRLHWGRADARAAPH